MQSINWNSAQWQNPVGGAINQVNSFEGRNEIFINYGVAEGDVIEFPPVSMLPNMRFLQHSKSLGVDIPLLRVLRNGNPSYLAVGCLSTTDADRMPVDDFRREMLDYQDAESRVQHLCEIGARIRGVRKEKRNMTTFKDRKPDGSKEKDVVIIEYV